MVNHANKEGLSIPIDTLLDAGIIRRDANTYCDPLDSIRQALQTVNWEAVNDKHSKPFDHDSAQQYLSPAPELSSDLIQAFDILREANNKQQYDSEDNIIIGEKKITFPPPPPPVAINKKRGIRITTYSY